MMGACPCALQSEPQTAGLLPVQHGAKPNAMTAREFVYSNVDVDDEEALPELMAELSQMDSPRGGRGGGGRSQSPAAIDGRDCEIDEEPKWYRRPSPVMMRRRGICAEPWVKGYYKDPVWNKHGRWDQLLLRVCSKCLVFKHFGQDEIRSFVAVMSTHFLLPSEREPFVPQGVPVDSLLIILEGTLDAYRESTPVSSGSKERRLVASHGPGDVVDESAIIWTSPRPHSLVCSERSECIVAKLSREHFTNRVVRNEFNRWWDRKVMLQQVPLLEMMCDEDIAKMTDVLELKVYEPDKAIITQGEEGDTMFFMNNGEAKCMIRTGADDVQEHKRYYRGDLFGEIALLRNVPRQASIIAVTRVEVWALTRHQFERLLGPMAQLRQQQYLSDPRKLIADFYSPSDTRGPRGSLRLQGWEPEPERLGRSSWFVVYRPTSRDAIARMLSGTAVGKGLNVKGKSAKSGILSGLVPFVQVSDNGHKKGVEASPSPSRIKVYYKNKAARDEAKKNLQRIMAQADLKIDVKRVDVLEDYEPKVFGLDVPEPLLREAYIMMPDLSPVMGWETGRRSEPFLMNANLHAVRDASEPKVVLFQNDESDAMNPRGLLIAYAEKYVKPVVSDFDTYLVASKGMVYEKIPSEQNDLAKLALRYAKGIFETPDSQPWTNRWIKIIETEAQLRPVLPKYGFGDPTSTRLIADVVTETAPCGAIRHGAECFNFSFCQELDDEYLVVWDGFPGEKPWAYFTEPQLRDWLMERVRDGFVFPLNPCWCVRDKGWYDVLTALRESDQARPVLGSWYPPGAAILETIDSLHKSYPNGFQTVKEADDGAPAKGEEEPQPAAPAATALSNGANSARTASNAKVGAGQGQGKVNGNKVVVGKNGTGVPPTRPAWNEGGTKGSMKIANIFSCLMGQKKERIV